MPFPRAKSNLYEYGTHMPLVIYFRKLIPGGRMIDDLVSLTDIAPTFLEIAGLEIPDEMSGKSLIDNLVMIPVVPHHPRKMPKSGSG